MKSGHPEHIAIILDGNRRFAKRLMKEPWKGHEYGAGKVQKLLDWTNELEIKEFTLYCLSSDNIKSRPKNELEYLFKLIRKELRNMRKDKIKKYGIKIKFVGDFSLIPIELAEQCKKLELETKNNKNYTLNFALAYGGREEIISAVKSILKNKTQPENINHEVFEKSLWLSSQPDLIIRTGGECRTSNFLPWQSTYSEWLFLDKFWPDFEKQDLINAIDNFKSRKRRFGK